jgi:myo-inositol-1(or 4)-monophosphatase
MHPMLNTAVKAARRAGAIIERASQNLDLITVQKKSRNDFVSEVDRAAEAAIIEILLGAYPEHEILAEESGGAGRSDYQWIVDPLDGTTNFLHGFPQYSISIALSHKGQVAHAVIYDPTRNDLFTASRGRGAFLNERRMRVSKRAKLEDSLIGTGFPFREIAQLDRYIAMFRELTLKTSGIRRPGSAALDLAYTAAGRYDGFWEMGLHPWDMAAGALMIVEAGGLVSDFSGNQTWLATGDIVAGNPKIFAQLLKILAAHYHDTSLPRHEVSGEKAEREE